MAGCFGNSDYDKYLENETLNYTDPEVECETCGSDDFCPECEECKSCWCMCDGKGDEA